MRRIQQIKKNPSFFVSAAQILSLLIVFGIGGCKGCGKGSDTDTIPNLSMAISPASIVDNGKVIISIKNEAEKISADEAGHEVGLEKAKLMVKFVTQTGGTGSEFEYEDETGSTVRKSEINETLDKFKGYATLPAQDTKTVNLGVEPGTGVTSAEFEITLFIIKEDGAEEMVKTEKVTWSKTSVAELQLAIVQPAVGNTVGKFTIKVAKADIKPSDIVVSWASNNTSIFEVANQAMAANLTLATLLGNDTVIKAGNQSAEISYKFLGNTGSEKAANITLSLKKGGQELLAATANKLTWNAKDLGLGLAVTKDNAAKTITYTVSKKAGVAVEATDNIVLHYKKTVNTNAATLTKGAKGTEITPGQIVLKGVDFGATDQVKDDITVNLGTEQSVEVTLELFYDGVAVPGSKQTVTVEQDIKLSIGTIVYDKAGGNKVKVEIKNDGTDEAKGVKLAYTTASTVAKIGGNQAGLKDTLVIPASGSKDVDLDVLNLGTEPSAAFTFTLSHGTKKVEDKTHTFTAKNFTIAMTAGPYDPATGNVEVTVKNTGTDVVEAADNLVLHYSLDNGAVIHGGTDTSGSKNVALAHTNGEDKTSLKIDLKDAESSTLILQLKLDGKNFEAPVSVVCAENVVLTVTTADKDFSGTTDRDINLTVKNTGVNPAAQANLKVRLVRKKGRNSTINTVNPGVNADDTKDIAASAGLATEEKSIVKLTLDPKDDEEVEIQAQLLYRGALVVGSEKTITWNRNVKVDFVNTDPIDLAGKKVGSLKAMLQVVNPGVDKAVADKVVLKAKLIEGTNAKIKVGTAVSVAVGKANFAEVYTSNKDIAGGALATDLVQFEIEPGADAKVVYELQLFYNGQPKKTKQVTWEKQEPKIVIVNLIAAELRDKQRTFNYNLKNTGTGKAEIVDIKLKVTNNSLQEVTVGGTNIKTGAYAELAGNDIVGAGDLAATNGEAAGLKLALDPLTNAEVSLVLEPMYDTQPQGNAKTVTWKATDLMFKAAITLGTEVSFSNRGAKITLTNVTGRELKTDELKILTLHYPAGDVQIHDTYGNGDINNKNLQDLKAATVPLADGDSITISISLVRTDNMKQEIPNIEVKKGTIAVMESGFKFPKVEWPASAFKFESKIELDGAATDSKTQPAKITLTNKSGRELLTEDFQVLTLEYAAVGNAIIHLRTGNVNINRKTLKELGVAVPLVPDDGLITIEVTLKRADEADKKITSVEVKSGTNSVMEGIPATLDWKKV